MVRNSEIRSKYGKFNDDEQVDHETEAVIGVYFKIMDRVRFRSISESGEQSKNVENGVDYSYMADQRQCRLCLQYFKQEEELMKIPMCEHILHIHCLKKWLIDFQKCPVCESNIIRLPQH